MSAPGQVGPRRIVCLTEETTEWLYLLGEQERIVGISGFTVRPPQARREKPRVSAFTSAKIERIVALKPDLVLGFSDLQAGIAAELIRAGLEVHVFNQRSVEEIFQVLALLGRMVGAQRRAGVLIGRLRRTLAQAQRDAAALPCRPRVYFEEWDDPLITGIEWVAELVRIAGGDDIFPELAGQPLARGRILSDPGEVVRRDPEIVFASWCGKRFRPEQLAARPGWGAISAVRTNQVFEIKSPVILQPGPAALTDGVDALHARIRAWALP